MYKNFLLILLLTISFSKLSFGQTTFTPATNLQIDLISSSNIDVSWTQGTNVLHYEIEFILDGVSTGVLTLPSSASSRSYIDPTNSLDDVDDIEVTLKSFGVNDAGDIIAIPKTTIVTVDEVYSIERLKDFCDKMDEGYEMKGVIYDSQHSVKYGIPCLCETIDYVEDDNVNPSFHQHNYHAQYHTQEYIHIKVDGNGTMLQLLTHLQTPLAHDCSSEGIGHHKKTPTEEELSVNEDILISQNFNKIVLSNIPNIEVLSTQFNLIDITGKNLTNYTILENNKIIIDKTKLNKGIYFIKLIDKNQEIITKKILID